MELHKVNDNHADTVQRGSESRLHHVATKPPVNPPSGWLECVRVPSEFNPAEGLKLNGKKWLAEVIISNHRMDRLHHQKPPNHSGCSDVELGLLFQRGLDLTSVQRNYNHRVQLITESECKKKKGKHPRSSRVSNVRGCILALLKTSKVPMNPLSDVMLLWLCIQVYMYNTK